MNLLVWIALAVTLTAAGWATLAASVTRHHADAARLHANRAQINATAAEKSAERAEAAVGRLLELRKEWLS